MATALRVFVDAASPGTRRRLVREAERAGWLVVARAEDAEAVLTAGGAPPAIAAAPADDDDAHDEVRPHEALTPREQDVLALLAEGAGNREIASRLGVTEHTVKFHLGAIFGKLGAATRTEALRRAIRAGWIAL
ncbi:MAG: response regulator transcription factor [Vicinamibacterales bacterium]